MTCSRWPGAAIDTTSCPTPWPRSCGRPRAARDPHVLVRRADRGRRGRALRLRDAVLVCGAIKTQPGTTGILANPRIVVEVLSPSTEKYDRGEKRELYQRLPSLTDYLLVAQSSARDRAPPARGRRLLVLPGGGSGRDGDVDERRHPVGQRRLRGRVRAGSGRLAKAPGRDAVRRRDAHPVRTSSFRKGPVTSFRVVEARSK